MSEETPSADEWLFKKPRDEEEDARDVRLDRILNRDARRAKNWKSVKAAIVFAGTGAGVAIGVLTLATEIGLR